jgi:hypothetical protein
MNIQNTNVNNHYIGNVESGKNYIVNFTSDGIFYLQIMFRKQDGALMKPLSRKLTGTIGRYSIPITAPANGSLYIVNKDTDEHKDDTWTKLIDINIQEA